MTTTQQTIYRPKLQPTVIAVPVSRGKLAIHRGTRQSDPNVIWEDPGWKAVAISHMNGERPINEIAHALRAAGHAVSESDISQLVDALQDISAVADANYFQAGSLTPLQMDRYSRNLNGFAALNSDGRLPADMQATLMRGHVLMLGLGGLGSATSLALAMAGCGRLSMVDFDHVENANLNRQLYSTADIGQTKVDAMSRRLKEVNPEIEVAGFARRLEGPDEVRSIVEQLRPDVVVAAIDRPTIAADRWVSDACFAAGVPAVFNSVSAGRGLVWSKVPGSTGCFQCDETWAQERAPEHYDVRRYREQHDLIPATSAFSYSAMAVAGMMTSEVVRYLVGLPMATAGRLVVLDFTTLATTITEKPAHPDCPVCSRGTGGRNE